jgi:hypothetical protein
VAAGGDMGPAFDLGRRWAGLEPLLEPPGHRRVKVDARNQIPPHVHGGIDGFGEPVIEHAKRQLL